MRDALEMLALLLVPVAMMTWLIGLVACWRGRMKLSLLSCAFLLLLPVALIMWDDVSPGDDYALIPIAIVLWIAAPAGAAIAAIVFAAGRGARRRVG